MRRLADAALAFGVFLALILVVLNWSSVSMPHAVAQQSPKIIRSSAPATTVTPKPVDMHPVFAPPGTELYEAKRGDSVGSLARQYVKRTSYLTSGELAEAIRKANGGRTSNNLKAGELIGSFAGPILPFQNQLFLGPVQVRHSLLLTPSGADWEILC